MQCLDRAGLALDSALPLGDLLARLAGIHRDDRLIEERHEPHSLRLTYAQAADQVERMAAVIAEAVSPGDRVVVATPNGYEQLLVSLAASRAGAAPVPVNPQMRPDEVDYVIADSGATLVVRQPEEVKGAEPITDAVVDARRPRPGDVAAIFYTSGTTGRPKGAELTHRALVGNLHALAIVPSGLRHDEVVAGLPVAHIMGFLVLLAAAAAGVPVYALPKFRADQVLDAIERRRSTVFIGVPAMYRLLLEAGAEQRDLSSIRVWASGADVMPADLARRFQRMGAAYTLPVIGRSIGDAAFAEGYGMVETAGAVAFKLSPPGIALPVPVLGGILGLPVPGNRLKVVRPDGRQVGVGQVGELVVRGPGLLAGYHGDAAATADVLGADGWLHTGDLARRGVLGTVSFAGRAKDVIKSGGYSVYAVEVERAMEEHPDVAEAAAVGIPDARLGERTAVAVRVRDGATVTEHELLGWGEAHLSDYKRPRVVRIVDELPRTGTEKVAKQRLRPLFAA